MDCLVADVLRHAQIASERISALLCEAYGDHRGAWRHRHRADRIARKRGWA